MLPIIFDQPSFKADVNISVPGKKEPAIVSFTFKYMPEDEYDLFFEEVKDKDLKDTVPRVVLGWDGFDSEFNEANLKTFFRHYQAAPFEIWMVWNKQLKGARAKN